MERRLTILLVSYDGYSDMWPTFFECKDTFWSDCPYPVVLANNEKDIDIRNVRVINCGKDAQWSTRTRKALESIDTKYVMFLLEDLFISDVVKTEKIERAIDLMDKEGINYYKIMTFSKINTNNFKNYEYLKQIPASLPYGISLQAAIWEKNHFLEMIGAEDYNPWVFEVRRLEDEKNSNEPYKLVGVYDNRNIMNICHMVVQGKFLRKAVKKMLQLGIHVDTNSRKIMSRRENFIYNLKLLVSSYTDKHQAARKILRFVGPASVVNKNT